MFNVGMKVKLRELGGEGRPLVVTSVVGRWIGVRDVDGSSFLICQDRLEHWGASDEVTWKLRQRWLDAEVMLEERRKLGDVAYLEAVERCVSNLS